MSKKIQVYDPYADFQDGPLPPEVLADPYNPLNDSYYKRLNNLRSVLKAEAAKLQPWQITACELHMRGATHKDIAKEVHKSPRTVSKAIRKGKEYVTYASLVRTQEQGPTVELRKNMIWRIAVDNEGDQPKVSLQALDMLNKIDGSYVQEEEKSNVVSITINNELLPPSPLDHDITPDKPILEHKSE